MSRHIQTADPESRKLNNLTQNGKLILTYIKEKAVALLLRDDMLISVQVIDNTDTLQVGEVYIGKIKNIVKNIDSCFVELPNDQICYLSMKDARSAYILNRKNSTLSQNPENIQLQPGDELPVQILRNAIKTKPAAVTTDIELVSEYFIFKAGNPNLGISNKISSADATRIKKCFEAKKPLEDGLHDKAMLLFKQYILVGGMPKSIIAFLEGARDFDSADREKRDILDLYRDDILKINTRYRSKVLSVFDQIPGFLSKHEKRVILGKIAQGSTIDQYTDTFFWLGNSMICNECFLTRDPNIGLALNEDRSYIKCYMGDTGLLVSHSFDEKALADSELYRQIINDNLSVNEGMLFENAIAQCLVANGYPLFFYTHYNEDKHRNDIEIDFIISNGSKTKPRIYPIEVKSGKRYTVKSMERFMDKFGARIGNGYVIHTKNLSIKDNIIYIPSYMTFCL